MARLLDSELKKYLGFERLYSAQEKIVLDIISDKNILAVQRTGFGKSICFQLSGLIKGGVLIVVSPLIALMRDQVNKLNYLLYKNQENKNNKAYYYNSSLAEKEKRDIIDLVRNFETNLESKRACFIYLAPESLENFLKKVSENSNALKNISLVVIDEAHCVLEWGKDFRPAYNKLPDHIRHYLSNIPKALFTASLPGSEQKKLSEMFFGAEASVNHINSVYRPNLAINIHKPLWGSCSKLSKYRRLKKILEKKEPTLVYCSTIYDIEALASLLSKESSLKDENGKSRIKTYHGQMTKSKRSEKEKYFSFSGCPQMLVTNAFGMGIDRKDIRQIVHYSPPNSFMDYYQEIGRAGRDYEDATCTLFYEKSKHRGSSFDDFLKDKNTCRWQAIRVYFEEGEEAVAEPCLKCDNCARANSTQDFRALWSAKFLPAISKAVP